MSDAPVVLIVDDNALNLQLLSFLLAAHGYEIRTAEDAPSAERVLSEVLPHIILMDVCLPGTDGLTLTRKLKSDPRTKGILIVAVTASAMKGDEETARAAGCDDYVSKPVDTRAFPGRIEKLLAAHKA
jgi:CheY-like chemotaxis protein